MVFLCPTLRVCGTSKSMFPGGSLILYLHNYINPHSHSTLGNDMWLNVSFLPVTRIGQKEDTNNTILLPSPENPSAVARCADRRRVGLWRKDAGVRCGKQGAKQSTAPCRAGSTGMGPWSLKRFDTGLFSFLVSDNSSRSSAWIANGDYQSAT